VRPMEWITGPEVPRVCLLLAVAAVTVAILLAGCGILPAERESYYYVLEYPERVEEAAFSEEHTPEPTEAARDTEASALGVVRVYETAVAELYDRRQIVRRLDGPVVQLLSDDMWGADIGRWINTFVRKELVRSGAVAATIGEYDSGRTRYDVFVSLDRIEFYDGEERQARLDMSLRLYDRERDEWRVQHEVRRRQPMGEGERVQAFVEYINAILLEELEGFSSAVRALGE